MYMISSNKLLRARKVHEQTLPFFNETLRMMEDIAACIGPEEEHVYLESYKDIPKEERVLGLIVVTDDKGLAGAFNHNVLRLAGKVMKEHPGPVRLYVIGEVGRHHFHNLGISIEETFHYTAQNPTLSRARHISDTVLAAYEDGELHEVRVVYSEPLSSMGAHALTRKVLPLKVLAERSEQPEHTTDTSFTLMPSPGALIETIVPNYMVGLIYGCLVESYCAAQSSRMAAMDQANRNAGEMIHELQVRYNRERQAVITQEITEIAAGAKALRAAKIKDEEKETAV